jgi:alginate O-acetyltransferase complex protein AlgJ
MGISKEDQLMEKLISRVYPRIFICVFILMLLLPLRTFALDPHTIDQNFYGRSQLITAVANLRVEIGDRVFPKVIVGDVGWLVYTAENDMDGYQHADPFTSQEMTRIQQSLDRLSERYAEQGIILIVVVPPNKNTIYPERVPGEIPVLGPVSSLDQLISFLDQHGKTQLLDLRSALLEAREEREIYYATDTHWNDHGAFIAYQEIMKILGAAYPSLTAHPASDYKVVTREPEMLDLSENIGTTLFPEPRVQFAPQFDSGTNYKTVTVGGRRIQFSYNPDSDLPSAIVYHDSFFFRVIPFLGEHFRSGIYIQNYMGGGLWSLSWVEEHRPDIVIIEFSERYIHDLPLLIDPQ